MIHITNRLPGLPLPAIALVCALGGCTKKEHSTPPLLTAPDPAPPVGSAPIAPADPVTPAGPPPGTGELFQVPDAIAAQVTLERVANGLARPVWIGNAPGDARKRMFVVLQHAGEIRILENGKVLPKPFLKIGNLSNGNEQGLLGLAFHPKYATNGKLYIHYTADDDATHIVEYKVSATDADAVDPKSAREIFTTPQPYSNHNGGHLLFGIDGKLYTGLGDGGSAGDPQKNGQNPQALLGKMLSFDVDDPKAAPSIQHLGVRNPWRFAFDTNGDLYIGDVGQNAWEYVFVVPTVPYRKHNFGWNVVEGSHCYRAKTCDKTGFTPPIAEYPHGQGCSITGGSVYRGKALPALVGRYFYADYCSGLLRSFVWTKDPSSPTAPGFARDHWEWKPAIDKQGVLQEISSFGTDADGELYIVELTGAIYKLVPAR